ncbi:MAG TPA: hypothetical protein VLD37_03850 [Candidatus Bilamarchaeum sp.]|nr:hypothetical protein [Candidatus Bilamarchaeum sp.]
MIKAKCTRPEPTRKAFPKDLSPLEEMNIDFLADEMASAWKCHKPPSTPLASNPLHGSGLLDIIRDSCTVRGALGGRMLIDLGAGHPWMMAVFARSHGVREYVAVDSHFGYSGLIEIPGVSLINSDMLRFMAYMPDSSANVCMNAIDGAVLRHPETVIAKMYTLRLMQEIARVVPEGGMAFGFSSPCLNGLGAHGLTRVSSLGGFRLGDYCAVYLKEGGGI